MLLKIRHENLLSMTSLNLQLNLQIGTPPVEDLSIIWDEIGLWEPIEMGKSSEIVERNSFCIEKKPWLFFLNESCLKKMVCF